MVEANVVYEGGLRCKSVHGPSGTAMNTDAPTDNLGRGEAFSPTDLTATSLATCMLTTMAIVAKKQGLPLEFLGSRAIVRKFMTSEAPRRIAKLEVELTLPFAEENPHRETIESAALNCPVALSLHPDVEKAVTFVWRG